MTDPVTRMDAAGALRPLERQLADLLRRMDPEGDPRVVLAAVVASRALADGHVCVSLAEVTGEPLFDTAGERVEGWTWPDPDGWREALQANPLVGAEADPRPLVLRGDLLYLARYARREAALAARLVALAEQRVPAVDVTRAEALLDGVFRGSWKSDEQRSAVRGALDRGLLVLAGGPGTGKTTTVVRLLLALIDQARARGDEAPEVALLAPTGKAAARLSESLRTQLVHLRTAPFELPADLLDAVPDTAATVHRALRPRNDWLTRFAYDEDNPLPADIVIVDEVSMVDLPLLDRVLRATRPGARVVLLGDPDQLPSVGTGSVLADVVKAPAGGVVGACVAQLKESRRFAKGGAVATLALAVRDAHEAPPAERAERVRASFSTPDAPWLTGGRADRDEALLARIVQGWTPFLQATTPEERLARLDHFRVLCATRVGAAGVTRMNRAIEAALVGAGLLPARRDTWFEGQPVLILDNDYQVELFNGDTGVIARDPLGRLRAWFEVPGDEPRAVLPAALPRHETVWAMTIHKSQGSEFDDLVVVLPEGDHRVLTRELLFTGVTRAKERLAVFGGAEALAACAGRATRRGSGLGERL